MNVLPIFYLIFVLNAPYKINGQSPEEEEGVKYANHCEVCKILTNELVERLQETGKSETYININYDVMNDAKKPLKRKRYRTSELRLIESLDGVCERILTYNIHKERSDSTRFAKGMSQTFETLHGLVAKGVKVDLGIPQELWDKPSVEITNMKTQCENLLERHEDDIEYWYFNLQPKITLKDYLCRDRYLKGMDSTCLDERIKGDSGQLKSKRKMKKNEL